MPKREMKPMMAGMLSTPPVRKTIMTPPISARGRFSSTMRDWEAFLNSPYSSMKMRKMLKMLTSAMVREARSSLSNWPPNSIR